MPHTKVITESWPGASGHCPRSADAHIRQENPNAEPARGCGHRRSNCRPGVRGSVRMRRSWPTPICALLSWIVLAIVAPAREPVPRTEANVAVELTFTAKGTYGDPFNEVTLDVIFADPRGRR